MTGNFGAKSTTDEVLAGVDLRGKRVLVTGVSAGLGVETARTLVAHGADVVGAARDLAKAERVTAGVREAAEAGGGSFELIELDLASLDSVRACADRLLADGRSFDIIIANAGVMAPPFGRTAEGFETQFGTNHLGHFVLVNRVAPLLTEGGRLVNLSSAGHRFADVDLDDAGRGRAEPSRCRAPPPAMADLSRTGRSGPPGLHRRNPRLRGGRLWTKTNMAPLRGWAPVGARLPAQVPHGHWRTMTFLAALRHDRVEASWLLDGPINGACFLVYVETVLVPTHHALAELCGERLVLSSEDHSAARRAVAEAA